MPRMKVIEIDGAKFTISPLTIRRLDDFLARQTKALEERNQEAMGALWREFICTVLNNALPTDASEKFDPSTIKEQLDLISFTTIRDAALEFSGIKLTDEAA